MRVIAQDDTPAPQRQAPTKPGGEGGEGGEGGVLVPTPCRLDGTEWPAFLVVGIAPVAGVPVPFLIFLGAAAALAAGLRRIARSVHDCYVIYLLTVSCR